MNTIKEVSKNCPVSFTAGAFEELKKIFAEKALDSSYALRVGVKGGGCSGMSYLLGFDKVTDKDDQFVVEDLPVIMESAHGMYIAGMEIDYVNGLNNRGFIFNNPNATESCGCGTSFSA